MNVALRKIRRRNREALSRIETAHETGGSRSEVRAAIRAGKPRFVGMVPCRVQDIDFVMFSADDDVVAREFLWFGPDAYEPAIMADWVSWVRGASVVYDIGAYTGAMSVLAALASPAAEVHLFEPLERTVERAHVNLVANEVRRRVSLHAVAVSDRAGEDAVHLQRDTDFLGTGASLYDKSRHHPLKSTAATRRVRLVRLDDHLPSSTPDVVKIDVEGHELATLNGMRETIARGRPRMVVEVWPHTRTEVLDLLRGWGYTCTPYEADQTGVTNYRCEPQP